MVAYLKKKYPDLDIEIIDINIPAEDIVEVVPKVPFADDKYYIHRMVRDADLLVTIPVLKIIETCQVTLGLKTTWALPQVWSTVGQRCGVSPTQKTPVASGTHTR